MVTRRAMWTAYGITGVILLAAGFWGGKSLSPDAVTPDVLAGTVRLVPGPGGSFAVQLDGKHGVTSYGMWVSPRTDSTSPSVWSTSNRPGGPSSAGPWSCGSSARAVPCPGTRS